VTGYPCEDLTKGYSLHSVKKKIDWQQDCAVEIRKQLWPFGGTVSSRALSRLWHFQGSPESPVPSKDVRMASNDRSKRWIVTGQKSPAFNVFFPHQYVDSLLKPVILC